MKKVVIIGGGATGIMAALTIKKDLKEEVDVIILEKMDRIGKKIIVSGNGKCNISNEMCNDFASLSKNQIYNNDFAIEIIKQYPPSLLINDLLELGLFVKTAEQQRIYPITFSSKSVMELLLINLNNLKIKIYPNTKVEKVQIQNNSFIINTNNKDFLKLNADYVVFATGGMSAKKHGSSGDGYKLLESLKIPITNIKPGLVGLKTNDRHIKSLDGIRQKATVNIYDEDKLIFTDFGEVQFKSDGLSGIVIMNAATILYRHNKPLKLELNFINQDLTALELTLNKIRKTNPLLSLTELTHGILPKALADNILNRLTKPTIKTFLEEASHYHINIISDYGFDNSQVSIGGVMTNALKTTLELKTINNAYVGGELIDVDGLCGGYNMHFAFSCGAIIGHDIIRKIGKNNG